MADHQISWDRGVADIQLLGGMLGPAGFRLQDGRTVQPFAIAPWADDSSPEHRDLPGILKRLRGEWPCVPFGAPSAPSGLPESWRPAVPSPVGSDFHGHSSNNEWKVVEEGKGWIEIESEYPDDHPIRRLVRRIAGRAGEARLDMTLIIEARSAVRTPIALHPVFRLPAKPGGARISLGGNSGGRVFPMPVEPGVSRLVPDASFASLEHVPAHLHSIDLSRLPLPFDTEELVQVTAVNGRVELANEVENYRVVLKFDPAVFPSVLLWVSNRGRTAYPWNGRFVAVGIEPLRGAFDLGPDVGNDDRNPLAAAGYPTTLILQAGQSFSTSYSIGIEDAGGG